jgi:hypothetical protein
VAAVRNERIVRPSENFNINMQDVGNRLLSQSLPWKDWVENVSEISVEHVFQYYNIKRERFKQPIWQMLLHLFKSWYLSSGSINKYFSPGRS